MTAIQAARGGTASSQPVQVGEVTRMSFAVLVTCPFSTVRDRHHIAMADELKVWGR